MSLNRNHVLAGLALFFVALVAMRFFGKKDDLPSVAKLEPAQVAEASTIDAPFLCDDGSHFVAAFDTRMKQAEIMIDGTLLKTVLLATSTVGKVFKDAHTTFTFKGENVTITWATMPKPVVCHPPQDPNNAPMNFGD